MGGKLSWRFNPCFNGTMYKNLLREKLGPFLKSFNPCFNGTMYKNPHESPDKAHGKPVSILVLMELCIKTRRHGHLNDYARKVSILVLMELCIKTRIGIPGRKLAKKEFQSLF